MKPKLGLALVLAALSLTSIPISRPVRAALTAADFCNSPRLKGIVDAVLCKRDNCGDEGKLNDYLFACTQVDPADAPRIGAEAVRIDLGQDTRDAAFSRVNDNYPLLEALTRIRLDPPPKFNEIPPCDCLAIIETRTQCKIEKCPVEAPAPAPAAPAPAADSNSTKAQVPDQPAPDNSGHSALTGSGGLCSLSYGNPPRQSTVWACLGILHGVLLLGWRRLSRMPTP